jgi:hypothetical protein
MDLWRDYEPFSGGTQADQEVMTGFSGDWFFVGKYYT